MFSSNDINYILNIVKPHQINHCQSLLKIISAGFGSVDGGSEATTILVSLWPFWASAQKTQDSYGFIVSIAIIVKSMPGRASHQHQKSSFFSRLQCILPVSAGGRCMYFSSTSRGRNKKPSSTMRWRELGCPIPGIFQAHLENITTCTGHLCACVTYNYTSIIYIYTHNNII